MASPWDRISEQIGDMTAAQAERDARLRERMAVTETRIMEHDKAIELLHEIRKRDGDKLEKRFEEFGEQIMASEERITQTMVTGRLARKDKRFAESLRFWSPIIVAILGLFGVALSAYMALKVAQLTEKADGKRNGSSVRWLREVRVASGSHPDPAFGVSAPWADHDLCACAGRPALHLHQGSADRNHHAYSGLSFASIERKEVA